MDVATSDAGITYLVEINPVKEVILVGAADLAFWGDRLQSEALIPDDHNGAAQLMITATAMRWMGLSFRELIISVSVRGPTDGFTQGGFYLVQAYNSARVLALMERALFQTPYTHGIVEVEARAPASMRLRDGEDTVFDAGMLVARPCIRDEETWWAGPIFLSRHRARPRDAGRLFFAKLGGQTATYPFLPARDTFALRPGRDDGIWRWLDGSGFMGQEWRVRGNAVHARSKTYRRP